MPNTQYAVYTTSVIVTNTSKVEGFNKNNNNNDDDDNDDNPAKVESSPSETLVAWTDPAFPAFVEVTLVLVSLVQLPGMYWWIQYVYRACRLFLHLIGMLSK